MTAEDRDAGRSVRLTVPADAAGTRIDKFLGGQSEADISRTRAQKLIDQGLVLVDGQPVAVKHRLNGGELIVITVPPGPPSVVVGEDLPLDIVFEDDYLAVVNKPAGMVTHPAPGNRTGTLVNAIVHYFHTLSGAPGVNRPGIVHRLDKDTSGLLVVARDDSTYAGLQKAIQSRQLKRIYLALVWGHLKDDRGEIDMPVGRSPRDRKKMAVTGAAPREAITRYRVVERFRSYDLLEVSLQTGRTHQIRVHFSHLGHPVFGDPQYGGRLKAIRGLFGPERPLANRLLTLIDRQALHAFRLEFLHPITGLSLEFESPPPPDMSLVLATLRQEGR